MKSWVRKTLSIGVLAAGALLFGPGVAHADTPQVNGDNGGVLNATQIAPSVDAPAVAGVAQATGLASTRAESGSVSQVIGGVLHAVTPGHVATGSCGGSIGFLGFAPGLGSCSDGFGPAFVPSYYAPPIMVGDGGCGCDGGANLILAGGDDDYYIVNGHRRHRIHVIGQPGGGAIANGDDDGDYPGGGGNGGNGGNGGHGHKHHGHKHHGTPGHGNSNGVNDDNSGYGTPGGAAPADNGPANNGPSHGTPGHANSNGVKDDNAGYGTPGHANSNGVKDDNAGYGTPGHGNNNGVKDVSKPVKKHHKPHHPVTGNGNTNAVKDDNAGYGSPNATANGVKDDTAGYSGVKDDNSKNGYKGRSEAK